MKYEFCAGDYIRMGDLSGYLTSCGYILGEYRLTFMLDDGEERGWRGQISELPSNITRIGRYQFTSENKPISKIDRDRWGTTGSAVLDKIDELVDAVNELRMREGAGESNDQS